MAHSFVIFGASGDLTERKLIPALYQLFQKDRLPQGTKVVGVARTVFSHDQFRAQLKESTARFAGEVFDEETWDRFAQHVYYAPGDVKKPADFESLASFLKQLEDDGPCVRVYYLATMPQLYSPAIAGLGAAGLAEESPCERRIVIEKPFGTDIVSARALNNDVHRVFQEHQVYRIDHYLGKETVQNMLVLRFANSIFEPIWNRNYIDHVQITVAEEVAVGDRAAYYDSAGVLRDMFQNHLLQLLMITAMEAPSRYEADLVRDEKVKVLRAIRPMGDTDSARDTVRARYHGYAAEEGVARDSQTATFAAIKLHVDNWRWNNVPFYLRSGKAMSCRTTQIVIRFRDPPHMLFDTGGRQIGSNQLVIQIQPAEGIQLHFHTKVPDAGMQLRLNELDFRFRRGFSTSLPDAYQRLLLDALLGDASLFARSDEVELAWKIIDPIVAAWHAGLGPPVEEYEPGGWGPSHCTEWMLAQGRQWFDVCPVLH